MHILTARAASLLTAGAVALSLTAAPSPAPAQATPIAQVRLSAHGQWICQPQATAADTAAATSLAAAYTATIKQASQAVQAKYPAYASTFNAVTGAIGPSTVTGLVNFPALSSALKRDGYNDADIAAIILGAKNPEALITSNVTATLLDYPEASINRATTLAAGTSGNRAPLLSDGTTYSAAFSRDLRTAEASTNLASAIASFEATSGNVALNPVWQECVRQLQAQGATIGLQSVPEIGVPISAGKGGSAADDATTGIAIFAGVVALALAIFGGHALMTGQIPGVAVPALPFPMGR